MKEAAPGVFVENFPKLREHTGIVVRRREHVDEALDEELSRTPIGGFANLVRPSALEVRKQQAQCSRAAMFFSGDFFCGFQNPAENPVLVDINEIVDGRGVEFF